MHWRASCISGSSKYGKRAFVVSKIAGGLLWEMYVYRVVCIVLGREIMF